MSASSIVEQRVLAIVEGLVGELELGESSVELSLGSLLEEDLGIFSLERIELVARIEATLGIRVADELAAAAESVGDLIFALRHEGVGRDRRRLAPPRADRADDPPRKRGSRLYTAYVACLLAAATFVLWPLLALMPPGRRAFALMRRSSRVFLRAAGLRVTVTGDEHLRECGSAVLVANHESYLDSTVVLAALPIDFDVVFVANERLAGSGVVGTASRAARCLIVDRTSVERRLVGAAAIESALRRGESIFVFPESTLAATVRMLPFRAGAFAAAVATRRPVVPITLAGTRSVLPSGDWRLERGRVSVTIHPPIHPEAEGWRETSRLRSEARRRIRSAQALEETVHELAERS